MHETDESPEDDAGHVSHLIQSVRLSTSVIHWWQGVSVAWALFLLTIPLIVGIASGEYLAPPSANPFVALDLLGFGLAVVIVLILSVVALRRWRVAIGVLDRDLPADSPWRLGVLRRTRGALRFGAVGLVAIVGVGLVPVAVVGALASMGPTVDSGPHSPFTYSLFLAYFTQGILLAAVEVKGMRALILPIAGSFIPAIDRELDQSHRWVLYTCGGVLIPPSVLGAALLFPDLSIWPAAMLGLIAPLGLLLSLWHLGAAEARWLDLAGRLAGAGY